MASSDALLKGVGKGNRRNSAEEAFQPSSDEEYDSDALDYLPATSNSVHNGIASQRYRLVGPRTKSTAHGAHSSRSSRKQSWLRLSQRWARPRTACFLVAVILLAGLFLVLGAGSLWVYKTAPKDGVRRSEPRAHSLWLTDCVSNPLPGTLPHVEVDSCHGRRAIGKQRLWLAG